MGTRARRCGLSRCCRSAGGTSAPSGSVTTPSTAGRWRHLLPYRSRRCGQTDRDVFVGVDTVTLALGDETVSHPRVAFGGRSIDYRHLLLPLSRKPQALRQVASELVAQFGDPWPALWNALRSLHSPDEIEAARRLAPWLERADREGVGRPLARAIDLAIADGSLVTAPRRSSRHDAPTHVPLALQIYTVEAPDLTRYDALLRASA